MSAMRLHTERNDCCPLSEDSIQNGITSFWNVTAGGIIIGETLLGALGNLPLLCHYLILHCTECQVRAKDLIFMHLTLSNSLVIFSKGVPHTMEAFGLKNGFSVLECHFVSYVQRVGRSVSIGTTCLLFVFQAIMVSPINSCWKNLKLRIPHYISISISIYWNYYLLIYLFFPLHKLYVSRNWHPENNTSLRGHRYCFMEYSPNISFPVYTALIVFPEVAFYVLIVWASGSMILFLHRHKQRVQHIHRIHVSPRSSAESRVTQRILALLSASLCFYTPLSILSMCLALIENQHRVLYNIAICVSLCFPVVSPFLIMNHHSTVSKLSCAFMMTRRSNDEQNKKTCVFFCCSVFQIKLIPQ